MNTYTKAMFPPPPTTPSHLISSHLIIPHLAKSLPYKTGRGVGRVERTLSTGFKHYSPSTQNLQAQIQIQISGTPARPRRPKRCNSLPADHTPGKARVGRDGKVGGKKEEKKNPQYQASQKKKKKRPNLATKLLPAWFGIVYCASDPI